MVQLLGGWLNPWEVGCFLSVAYMFDMAILSADMAESPFPQAAACRALRKWGAPLCRPLRRSPRLKKLTTALEATPLGKALIDDLRRTGAGKLAAAMLNTAYWVALYQAGLGYFPRYGLPWMRGMLWIGASRFFRRWHAAAGALRGWSSAASTLCGPLGCRVFPARRSAHPSEGDR